MCGVTRILLGWRKHRITSPSIVSVDRRSSRRGPASLAARPYGGGCSRPGGAAMVRSSPQTLGCVGSDAEAEPLMSEPRKIRRRPKSKGKKSSAAEVARSGQTGRQRLDKRHAAGLHFRDGGASGLDDATRKRGVRKEEGERIFFPLSRGCKKRTEKKKRLKIYAGSAAAARRTGMQKRAVRTGVVQADYYGGAVVGSKGAARLMRAPRCNNNRAARATCHLSMIWEGGEYLAGSGD